MNKFLEILKRWFDSIVIDEQTKEISISYNEKMEKFNIDTEFSKEFFASDKRNVFLPKESNTRLLKSIGELEFLREWTKVTISFNKVKLEDIFEWEDFEDLYYALWTYKAVLTKNKKKYKEIGNIDEKDAINKGVLTDKNFFAYEIPGKENISFRISHIEKYYTVRKIPNVFSFLDVYGDDIMMLLFFAKVLTTDASNKSILLSWSTGSWKTSMLIAFIELLNKYGIDSIKKAMIYKILNNNLDTTITIPFVEYKKKSIEEIKEELVSYYKMKNEKVEELFNSVDSYLSSNLLDKLIETYDGGTIFSIEKPIEKKFDNENIFFIQTDVAFNSSNEKDSSLFERGETIEQIWLKKFLLAAEVSLQSNPSLVYISELKKDEEFKKFLDIITTGFPVLATNHSWDIFQNLERILWVDMSNERSMKNKLISWLGWIMNLKRYRTKSKNFLISYEYLILEPDIGKQFVNNDVAQFKQLVTKVNIGWNGQYVSHQVSLFSTLYRRWLKNKEFEVIIWMDKEAYEDLFRAFNRETVSKYYGYEILALNAFSESYIKTIFPE